MAGLPVITLLAWLVPPAAWPALARAFTPFQLRDLTGDAESLARVIDRTAGSRLGGQDPRDVLGRLARHNILAIFLMLRALRRRAPLPAIRLRGAEHIAAALAAGRGAILWTSHFTYAATVAKMAWHQAGYAVAHLSHPRHGFSSSSFGMQVINAAVRRAEDRFLGERVLMAVDSPTAALRTLARHLAANRIVSITARVTANRPVGVPFLDGELVLAPGALELAHATGAPVLPVFVARAEDGFEVVVEAPLPLDRTAPRRAAVVDGVRAFARRLEPHVIRHADQWLGWAHM